MDKKLTGAVCLAVAIVVAAWTGSTGLAHAPLCDPNGLQDAILLAHHPLCDPNGMEDATELAHAPLYDPGGLAVA